MPEESGACTQPGDLLGSGPVLIAHADWGTGRRKRQVAVARLKHAAGGDHASYAVESLAPAVDGGEFFGHLREAAGAGQAMAGFDFP
jgi:hypothetical protein